MGDKIHSNLEKKFPECKLEKKVYFLEDAELLKLKEKYPTKNISAFYNYYEKSCSGKMSRLFVSSDVVRTLKQFLLIEIKDKRIVNLEVLKFDEPVEYKVQPYWLEKFYKITSLSEIDKMDGVSGATLTSRSTKYLSWVFLYVDAIIK
ncbi:FMN-binding protein [Bacteriovorax sp. Seq25_V]|uniref:FMN-binding protein n=1 Tax=Bacteriovorax sp. Seq25_V TaxID=1201288 RepID=UPI0004038D1B|nr:FMN-binding protein [Bacteriovorax sp. Seq25_V]